MGRPSADYFKVEVPEEQKNRAVKPGDVSLSTIERVNGVFQVTFAWCDMVGVVHEKAFNRGDIFTNFDSVLKTFTETGLPFNMNAKKEFHEKLCQLATFLVKTEAPAPQEKKSEAPAAEQK